MQNSSSNNSFNKIFEAPSISSTSNSQTTTTTTNVSTNGTISNTAEVQAQFELLVELRRFINMDLFQRGYYQIRVSIKCGNKQVPIKVVLQLENNKNNQNLSDSMYPSCVLDEYAISKTFLILYRNEEINLDDQILFKISTLVNAFNLAESFEKLDLQLFMELWFTENDYKPVSFVNLSTNNSNNSESEGVNSLSTGLNSNTNTNGSNNQLVTIGNNNGMQLLCSRLFKVHFDPRQGIHVQIPVVFDYFHLSAVLATIHCTLLTLLPPVAIGTNAQRNSTLSTILFGKDLSKLKSNEEINPALMKRAAHLHNQICGVLLSSYEYLQDHISKMCLHLDEFKKKNLETNEYVNCQEKLKKITEIIDACNDPEALDDLANRHVAQCSAENIMQWCTYIENFSLNQTIAPFLASEYHSKRLKRFSETFFTKDLPRKNLHEYEYSDNYVSLNEMIRQSTYYQQLPELIISCDDLDGSPENIPIIFEDNYVSSNNEQQQYSPLSSNSFIFSSNDSVARKNSTSLMFMRQNSLRSSTASKQRKSSFSSNEMSMTSAQHQQQQQQHLSDSSNKLHKRLKKKIINGDVITNDKKKAVQLVSYRKVNDYFNDQVSVNTGSTVASTTNTDSGGSSNSVGSGNSFLDSQQNSVQSKLNKIKADLSTRVLTPPGSHRNISSSISNNNSNNSSLQSIIESKQLNKQAASATDLFRKNFNQNNQNGENSPSTTVKLIKQQSVSNSTSNNQENLENKPSFQSLTNLSSTTSDYSSMTPPNNNHKTTTDNNEHDYLDNEIPDTLNQIDISIKSDDTTLSDTTNSDQFSTSENKNNNNKQGPSDCSFKSRALYESFRGKPSTLERPRAKSRMNLGNLTNNDTLMKRNRDTSKKTIAEFLAMEDEDDDLIENRLEKSINSIQIDDNKLRKTSTGRVITPLKRQLTINTDKNSLSAILNENLFKFVIAKEDLKRAIALKYQGNIYSEFSSLFCTSPYFYSELTPKLTPSNSFTLNKTTSKALSKTNRSTSFISKSKLLKLFSRHDTNDSNEDQQENDISAEHDADEEQDEEEKLHLVVCVHGLDGNSGDLRLVRTYIELALPGAKIDFLMSEQNQDNTFDDIELMTKQLIKEINEHIEIFGIEPERISFIGHSLGNLIVRSTVAHDDFKPYVNRLHCYLSLSGPHLGTLYNSSGLINMGMWIMQKWKKSGSLLQLSLKDHSDLQKTFLYKLSTKPTFEYFKHVLLVASPQDRYVPFHSARIEMCKAAIKDSVYGNIYKEMVTNILKPIQSNPNITFKRYSAFHSLPSGTNNFIGRAAHIAVLDSELFVEKLVLVSVAKYFR